MTNGVAGVVATTVAPILTDVIVLLALKAAPVRLTVDPRAAVLMGWFEVFVERDSRVEREGAVDGDRTIGERERVRALREGGR